MINTTKITSEERKKLVKKAKKNSSFNGKRIYSSEHDPAGMNRFGSVFHFTHLRKMLS